MELWNFLNDQCDGVVIDFEIEIALLAFIRLKLTFEFFS